MTLINLTLACRSALLALAFLCAVPALSSAEVSAQARDATRSRVQVNRTELEQQLANLPLLLSQARVEPLVRNGRTVGMQLVAIHRGSYYEKLGLKIGDILKAVNGIQVLHPAQAMLLFGQLRYERSINVQLERAGQDKNLKYEIN